MRKEEASGFTLLELIITVAIIGILAAVAIPVYSHYVLRSKASETASVLQGIRDREEAYFTEYRVYTDDIDFTPHQCQSGDETARWETAAANLQDAWRNLGFWPDGPTLYAYRVASPYQDGAFAGGAFDPERNLCDTSHGFNNPQRPWFVAEACGDIDNDGEQAHFYISSNDRRVCYAEEDETLPDNVRGTY